jgi:hypothetical protein
MKLKRMRWMETCSMHRGAEKCRQKFLAENLVGSSHLGEIGIARMIILKLM